MSDYEIQKIQEYINSKVNLDSAHTLNHIERVYKLALLLADKIKDIDLNVLKIAALLHDVGRNEEDNDITGKKDHAVIGANIAEKILKQFKYSEDFIFKIKHCILSHRYRSDFKPKTKEAKILFDADKLDLLGCIGIIRSYFISKEYNQEIYSTIPLEEYITNNINEQKSTGRIKDISKHSPNIEFELKIRNIPNVLYYKTSKKIAVRRIKIMEKFYDQLKNEFLLTI